MCTTSKAAEREELITLIHAAIVDDFKRNEREIKAALRAAIIDDFKRNEREVKAELRAAIVLELRENGFNLDLTRR